MPSVNRAAPAPSSLSTRDTPHRSVRLGRYPGFCVLDRVRSGAQRLAVQAGPDATGLFDGRGGTLGITPAEKVLRVVEQPVGEVIGGALPAQAGDRRGEGVAGGLPVVTVGKPGPAQAAFGLQGRGEVSGLVGIEQG